MANLFRRGLTWWVRMHVPRERQGDAAVAMKARTAVLRERWKSLETRDRREAERRKDAALAALRDELDARLRAAGLRVLTAWRPTWADEAAEWRERLQAASDRPYDVEEGPNGERAPWTQRGDVLDDVRDAWRDVQATEGPDVGARFWKIATGEAPTIAEARDRWLAELERSGGLKAQTLAGHRAALRLLEDFLRAHAAAPSLAAVPLDGVTRRLAADFIAWRAATVSPKTDRTINAATVQREVSSLSGLWRWARRRGEVQVTPWEDQMAALPKRRRTGDAEDDDDRKRPFRPAELVALLRADGPAWAPNGGGYAATLWDATRLGLLTGLRANELAGLTVGDVVDDGKALRVRGGKTANAARTVPLCAPAAAVVKQRLASLPDQSPKAPLWPEVPPQGPDGRRGKMLSTRFGTAKARLLRGLDDGRDPRGVDLHSLRRSFAEALRNAMNGGERRITPNLIANLMGHAGATLAERTYARGARETDMRHAVNAMWRKGLDSLVKAAIDETGRARPPVVRTAPVQRIDPATPEKGAARPAKSRPRLGR